MAFVQSKEAASHAGQKEQAGTFVSAQSQASGHEVMNLLKTPPIVLFPSLIKAGLILRHQLINVVFLNFPNILLQVSLWFGFI